MGKKDKVNERRVPDKIDRQILKGLVKIAKLKKKEFEASLFKTTQEQRNDPNYKWMEIKSVVVNSEQAKEQLLKASKYIHDLKGLDIDIDMVNVVAHLYCRPELITIEEKEK